MKSGLSDLDIATDLGQPFNRGYCHLNPIFDFKPTNVEMLVMARLAFSMKKDRILRFMRRAAHRNCEVYQRFGQFKQDAFYNFHRQQAAELDQKDRELQTQFPMVYKQLYQNTKSRGIHAKFKIEFNEFGEI